MIEILAIWGYAMLCVLWGWYARGRHEALKAERERRLLARPHEFPPEFKQWLLDYITVNNPRRF